MEKEVEGCANLLLASSALTNFSLSGFWKFLLLFFLFFPPVQLLFFFAKSSSRRAAAKAKPTAARCQAKLEHMAATEPTDFHAYVVPLRRILALLSGLRVTVPSFLFFFPPHVADWKGAKKEPEEGFVSRHGCSDTDSRPVFPFKNLRPQLTPSLHSL